MKIKFLVCGIAIIITVIFFFPITTAHMISGSGEILNSEKEKIGNCTLSIEIRETKARTFCYNKQFSFSMDGNDYLESVNKTYNITWDMFCSITQLYYDEKENRVNICYLVYQNDLSFAVIYLNSRYYFIDNGANIPYSEIPVS